MGGPGAGGTGWHHRTRTSAGGAPGTEEEAVSNRTYRVTEIVGTSEDGVDQAIRSGVRRAAQTLRHVDWVEVLEIRGHVVDGEIEHFQVGMKIGFRLEDD